MTEVIVRRLDPSGIPQARKPPYVKAGWQGNRPAIPQILLLRPDWAVSALGREQAEKRSKKRKPHLHGTILSSD